MSLCFWYVNQKNMICEYYLMNNYQEEQPEIRKELMKKVAEIAKTEPLASRYFNIMQNVMKRGTPAILSELSGLKRQLKETIPGTKEQVIVIFFG